MPGTSGMPKVVPVGRSSKSRSTDPWGQLTWGVFLVAPWCWNKIWLLHNLIKIPNNSEVWSISLALCSKAIMGLNSGSTQNDAIKVDHWYSLIPWISNLFCCHGKWKSALSTCNQGKCSNTDSSDFHLFRFFPLGWLGLQQATWVCSYAQGHQRQSQ